MHCKVFAIQKVSMIFTLLGAPPSGGWLTQARVARAECGRLKPQESKARG